jgi:NAD(P)-dependent dehydrogenase (short-subunit alcohol dehydrogenase family)
MRSPVAVVTGANPGGIGGETALQLAALGFHVVLAVRPAKVRTAVGALLEYRRVRSGGGAGEEAADDAALARRLSAIGLELSDPSSPHAFASEFTAKHAYLDVLVNSAGLGGLARSPERLQALDGRGAGGADFDLVFFVNVLGHVLLTRALLPALRAAPTPRVVCVSSVMHHWAEEAADGRGESPSLAACAGWREAMHFDPLRSRYAASKLGMIVLAAELNRRYGPLGPEPPPGCARLYAVACNPGAVNSQIWYRGQLHEGGLAERATRTLFGALFLTPEQGAATSVAAAVSPTLSAPRSGEPCAYLAPYRTPALSSAAGALASFLNPLFEAHGPFAGAQQCAALPLAAEPTVGAAFWEACEAALEPLLSTSASAAESACPTPSPSPSGASAPPLRGPRPSGETA